MMWPSPAAFIVGTMKRVSRMGAMRLMCVCRSQSSGLPAQQGRAPLTSQKP